MSFLPEYITLFSLTVPVAVLTAVLAYTHFLFIVWYEGKKDGFYTDLVFDIFILATAVAGLSVFGYDLLYKYLAVYHYRSLLLKIDFSLGVLFLAYAVPMLVITVMGRRKKWSFFRLLDIYALGLTIFLMIFSAGMFMMGGGGLYAGLLVVLFITYFKVLIFRGYKYASGISFFIFNLLLVIFGGLFYRKSGYLIIYPLLFTIGVTVIYLKQKSSPMNYNLPVDFLHSLKKRLIKKDIELKKQEQLAKKEDPYMQPERQQGNIEIMDQAMLEDVQKEITDRKVDLLSHMRLQVRKALAFMKVGKYGTCEICGNPIDKARLKIYPEATRCIECASKSE